MTPTSRWKLIVCCDQTIKSLCTHEIYITNWNLHTQKNNNQTWNELILKIEYFHWKLIFGVNFDVRCALGNISVDFPKWKLSLKYEINIDRSEQNEIPFRCFQVVSIGCDLFSSSSVFQLSMIGRVENRSSTWFWVIRFRYALVFVTFYAYNCYYFFLLIYIDDWLYVRRLLSFSICSVLLCFVLFCFPSFRWNLLRLDGLQSITYARWKWLAIQRVSM